MNQIKSEINVFTIGDSSQVKTWSNVPFYFTEQLIQNGFTVNRIDISPNSALEKLYNKSIKKIIKYLKPGTSFDYFRSRINRHLTESKIKSELSKFKNAKLNIFLTFSFSAYKFSHIPCINFGDWTYRHYINYFLEREPDRYECKFIKKEEKNIKKASMVVTFYPGIKKYLAEKFGNPSTYCFGNIINTIEEPNPEETINAKLYSYEILYIGTEKYLDGARLLIEAFKTLKQKFPDAKLNIIGLKESNFNCLPEGIKCFGYLDKLNTDMKKTFYTLLKNAKVFINTTPKWGGFSSSNEAMYFFTPVIIAPYVEFIETFGNEINFGKYCFGTSSEALSSVITELFLDPDYKTKCLNAHTAVLDFKWETVASKFIEEANKLIN